MRREDYDIMHELEESYWWFAGMRKVILSVLSRSLERGPQAILDVGCGTGINLLWMTQHFKPRLLVGCDFSPIALEWCRETVRRAPSFAASIVPLLSRGDIRNLPFESETFDLATNLDVLDLFSDDPDHVRALGELRRILVSGGLACVRAPACQWLYSSHDSLFETRHRFSAGELRHKMTLAGFEIVRTTYANTILFPLAAVRRLLRRLGSESAHTDTQPWPKSLEWLNGAFEACLNGEARLLARGWRLPIGLSAICIGRKTR